MTQKEIKRLVKEGIAQEIGYEKAQEIGRRLVNIALSFGRYGMNGGLFSDRENGALYAVSSRNSTLFYLA